MKRRQRTVILPEFPLGLPGAGAPERAGSSWKGETKTRTWELRTDQRDGMPGAREVEVYLVLMALWNEQQRPKLVHFTRDGILKRLGWGDQEQRYQRLKQALKCLAELKFTATYHYRDESGELRVCAEWGYVLEYALHRDIVPDKDTDSLKSFVFLGRLFQRALETENLTDDEIKTLLTMNRVPVCGERA